MPVCGWGEGSHRARDHESCAVLRREGFGHDAHRGHVHCPVCRVHLRRSRAVCMHRQARGAVAADGDHVLRQLVAGAEHRLHQRVVLRVERQRLEYRAAAQELADLAVADA